MGELRDKNIVTHQGKQGWWTRKSAILPYLVPITKRKDLANIFAKVANYSPQIPPEEEPEAGAVLERDPTSDVSA